MRKIFYLLSQVITTQSPVRPKGEVRVTYEINPASVHTMGKRPAERPASRIILGKSDRLHFEH